MNMWIIAIFLFSFELKATATSLEEKRIQSFEDHLLKKQALELERLRFSEEIKAKRIKALNEYERAREQFKRPTSLAPRGREDYEKRMEKLNEEYNKLRQAQAESSSRIREKISDEVDKIKMLEYGI